MPRYKPGDAFEIPRFAGVRTFMRLPHVTTTEAVDVAVIGIPFDTGASYRVGARFGPAAVRSGSTLLRPYNPVLDVNIFDHLSVVDYGDLPIVPGSIELSYQRIEAALTPIVEAGVIPVCLGGDHSITLPELRVLARRHGPLGLVHVDAHADTWDEYWSMRYTHGTVFRRAADEGLLDLERCIQVGMRGPLYGPEDYEISRGLGFELIPMVEVREMGLARLVRRIEDRVGCGPTFLSVDVDSADPACAPGTGTPEVGGFSSSELLELVRSLRFGYFVGADVVEVLPSYDVAEITAMLAANVAYEFLSLIALARRASRGEDASG